MQKDKYKALFILGEKHAEVTGWDAHDIINKVYGEIASAVESAKSGNDPDDRAMATKLEEWRLDFTCNPGDMHRMDRFDFTFTFGRYACVEWSEPDTRQ